MARFEEEEEEEEEEERERHREKRAVLRERIANKAEKYGVKELNRLSTLSEKYS